MLEISDVYPDLPEILDSKLAEIFQGTNSTPERCADLEIILRTSAIGALLIEYDVTRFHHMLWRAALTRIHALTSTPKESRPTCRFLAASRLGAFFSAIASHRPDLAAKLASDGRLPFNSDFEYEDDHCYAVILMDMINGASAGELAPILKRFAEMADDSSLIRHALCTALLHQDESSFTKTFTDLIDLRLQEIEQEAQSPGRDEMDFCASRYVFIEGLALLNLARRFGFTLSKDYPLCPRETFTPVVGEFQDHWYPGAKGSI